MPAGPEGFDSFAFVEKDPDLTFPNAKLGTPFDFSGTCFRQAMNQLWTAFIKPLQVFKENKIGATHGYRALSN